MPDYIIFLKSLSWDEFKTYEKIVDKDNLSSDQRQDLKEESGRRAAAFNKYMSF
jgi:hypothetical protein